MTLKLFTGDEQDTVDAPTRRDRTEARKHASTLITSYVQEVKKSWSMWVDRIEPKNFDAGRAILDASPAQQVAVAVEATLMLAKSSDSHHDVSLPPLLSALLRRKLPFEERSAQTMIQSTAASGAWELPRRGILRMLQRHIDEYGMSDAIRKSLEMMSNNFHAKSDHSEERAVGKLVKELLTAGDTDTSWFDLGTNEAWTNALLEQLTELDQPAQTDWRSLLAHCSTAKASQPSKKWLKQAGNACEVVGAKSFQNVMLSTLAAIGQPGVSQRLNYGGWTHYTDPTQIHDKHADLLRGLIWSTVAVPGEELIAAIGAAAESCFQKIPNVGPRSPKIGNACLQALSRMQCVNAVAEIGRLKTRAKHASIRKQLAKALERAADSIGMSAADLEEIAVPTLGLTDVGRHQQPFGEFTAELTVSSGGKTQIVWRKPDGKTQKSVPASIKESHADEIKSIRKQAKDIEKLFPAQRQRLEHLFLQERKWSFQDFRKRFLDHPLVGTLGCRLIWRFQQGDQIAAGIWHDKQFVTSDDQPISWINDKTEVMVWHPMFTSAGDVLAWREWLERNQVTQPFKQAHREVYILTDAERTTNVYSNRFAAHIIRQHQFAALCQQRGWRYSLQGEWDSANTPRLELPEWGLGVEFWVDPLTDNPDFVSESYIYLYLSTDQVRFESLVDRQPLSLAEVPEIVFSEIMRDVDLFVGVGSVGNDPAWADGGPGDRNYWQDFAFGDLSQSAQTRKEVLQRVIPRLAIADRCRFEDRFLVVQGKLKTYKIHLGSGNILMLPNDQYLCIVPKRGAGAKGTTNLFLPFDDDRTMSIILSKAFLLADDDKIKDDSIRSQIRG